MSALYGPLFVLGVWRVLIINTSVGWLVALPHPKNFLSMGFKQPEHGCSTPCHYVEGWCECPPSWVGVSYISCFWERKTQQKQQKTFFSLPGVYAPPTPGASSPLLLYLERTHRPARSPTSLGSPIAAVRNAFTNFFSHFATALPITRARKRSSFRRYRAGIRKGNRGKK